MRNIVMMVLFTMISFMACKCLFIIVCKIPSWISKTTKEKNAKFEFMISVSMQVIFIETWVVCVKKVMDTYGLNELEFYIALCTIGISCIVWCYFSWDAERIFRGIHIASNKERRVKKTAVYIFVLIFTLFQGYHQTCHVLNPDYQVDSIYSITNYSIIVAMIALDRVLNQVCIGKDKV